MMEITEIAHKMQPLLPEVETVSKQPFAQLPVVSSLVSTTERTMETDKKDFWKNTDENDEKTWDSIQEDESQIRNQKSGIGGRVWIGVAITVIIGRVKLVFQSNIAS